MSIKKEGDKEQYEIAGEAVAGKMKVMYCPECSHISDPRDLRHNCCPDNEPQLIDVRIARQAKAGFKVLYCPTNGT